jgi:hypothetical protein
MAAQSLLLSDVTCACALYHYVTRACADTKEMLPQYCCAILLGHTLPLLRNAYVTAHTLPLLRNALRKSVTLLCNDRVKELRLLRNGK